MSQETEYVSLTQIYSVINGFIAGILIAGGLLPYGFLLQALLFLVGCFIMVDLLLPAGEMAYTITALIFAAIGFILTLLAFMWQAALWMIIPAVVVGIGLYFFRFTSKKKGEK